ncbi:MAG: hypothetical protein LKF31_08535 [Muribaculaceae bacterium]|jgi:hypothetical protein|nr:hypothetical protein [Muribaculaceae bacterium]
MKRSIIIAFYVIFSHVLCSAETCAPLCASHNLQDIAEQLSKYVSLGKDILICPQIAGNFDIKILKDTDGKIKHIGINMFNDKMIKDLGEPVCLFIERYLLEISLKSSDYDAAFINNSSGVELLYNGAKISKAYSFIRNFLLHVNATYIFSYSNNKKSGITAIWSKGNQRYAVHFMPTRELLFGTDKKEADDIIKGKLTSVTTYDVIRDSQIPIKDLQPLKNDDNLYIKSGAVFTINSFNQDAYYKRIGDFGIAVFDSKYQLESLRNLSLGLVNIKNAVARIHHNQYGSKISEYEIPFAKLICVLMREGNIYCGVEKVDANILKSVVIIDHPRYNYIHMLRISVNREILFGLNPKIDVQLYTNIPQQNIKTLFNK